MGNMACCPRGEDIEGDAAASAAISQAAAQGAGDALRREVERCQRLESSPGANLADEAPAARVAGVLSVPDAQTAAADGATHGIEALARRLQPSARFACVGRGFQADINNALAAAAAGSAAGVKVAAMLHAQNAQANEAGEGIDPDIVIALARAGARAGALAVRVNVTSAAHSARYTSLLLPVLGGSLPASVAAYHLLSSSTDAIKATVFGMIVLGVLCASSGLAAGTLGSSRRSLCYCRFATLSSFAIVWLFFFFGLCSLFTDKRYWYGFGSVGAAVILAFAIISIYHRWQISVHVYDNLVFDFEFLLLSR